MAKPRCWILLVYGLEARSSIPHIPSTASETRYQVQDTTTCNDLKAGKASQQLLACVPLQPVHGGVWPFHLCTENPVNISSTNTLFLLMIYHLASKLQIIQTV